jgi:hypothetical protein
VGLSCVALEYEKDNESEVRETSGRQCREEGLGGCVRTKRERYRKAVATFHLTMLGLPFKVTATATNRPNCGRESPFEKCMKWL